MLFQYTVESRLPVVEDDGMTILAGYDGSESANAVLSFPVEEEDCR